jgi:cell division protein FtsN
VAPVPSAPPSIAVASQPAFEIVVASFRTEARAAAVAAQVSDAGLPVRRREAGGWQQVIAGPFASREAAAAAQVRLERAGVTRTQIAPAQR